jgi:hypothetical protein
MIKQPLNWEGGKMTTTLQKPDFEIITVKPVFGVNYNKGYIGFTYNGNHPIGQGIAYFTKWAKISNIYATHALIVKDEKLCIEADALKNCVTERPLKDYFDDEKCQIFFRKPKDLTDDIANRILQTVKPEVGKKYDFKLILTQALAGTFAGHFFDQLLRGKFEDKLAKILNNPNKWICSELAAYALDEQPEYKDQGILKRPNATISPQELFEDSVIFEPWKEKIAQDIQN